MRDEKSEVSSCQILEREEKDKKNSFRSFSVDENYDWNGVGGVKKGARQKG